MSSSSKNINKLGQRLLAGVAFTLPLQIFALPVGGKAIELAHLLSLLLILLASLLLVWKGSWQPLVLAEKGVLLCFGVICLSLVVAQIIYGWPEQLAKGLQQVVGVAFMVLVFMTVRRYASTPGAFRQIVAWLWRGLMLLAIFGLWQWLAFNLFKVSFLADWSWASNLNPSIGGWRFGGYMGPLVRVNSFAPEPAFYCQLLLMGLGLAVVRLVPPPWVGQSAGKAWKTYLPSMTAAIALVIAYLLSLSLVGLVGLLIATVSYLFLTQMAKKIVVFILIGLVIIATLDLASGGTLLSKFGTISLIMPGTANEMLPDERLSALVLASNLSVALQTFMNEPLLGCGIGGHVTAFSLYAPSWVPTDELIGVFGIGDAASLGLRLLSETGIIGLTVFLGSFFLILRQAWRAVRFTKIAENNKQIMPLCLGILTGTIATVLIYLGRMGNLIMISFWFLLALTAAIPAVLKAAETAPESQEPTGA